MAKLDSWKKNQEIEVVAARNICKGVNVNFSLGFISRRVLK
jgi:hypothetical protein